jgi:hypothetical protein
MAWDHDLYIPAGQKVNVSVTLPIMYSDFNFSKAMADDPRPPQPGWPRSNGLIERAEHHASVCSFVESRVRLSTSVNQACSEFSASNRSE